MDCGIYIHIPFCEKRCKYCNFFSSVSSSDMIDRYIKELANEIQNVQANDCRIKTIYLGGGTPSLLSEWHLETIFSAIHQKFSVLGEEITIEVNPNSSDKMAFYRQIGINRISIGLQSTFDPLLQKLGRIPTAKEGILALERANRYFDNVSADLILGVDKDQDVKRELKNINQFVTHLSAYMLTVEEDTPLYYSLLNKSVAIATEDEVIEQYNTFVQEAKESGLIQYETSNFAKNGMISKHNSAYWDLTPYLGFGAGAHSFFNGIRYYNEPNLRDYLSGNHSGNK